MERLVEATCTWPNGESRRVAITSREGNKARIIWNEPVESTSKCVTGFDDLVPAGWLTDITET